MPHPRTPLPAALAEQGFFRVCDARALGVSEKRLRRSDLPSPTSGVRWPADRDHALAETASAVAAAVPGDVAFSHLTAARLLGLPTPRPWRPAEPLDVMRDTDRPRIERACCRTHRGLETRQVVDVDGLRLVGPLDTWADLAPALALDDLVAAGDALLSPRGTWHPSDLASMPAARRGRRGSVRLARAASLVRAGSASPWESRARVTFHLAGLPEPELNVDVFSDDGVWLARPDLLWRRQRVLAEYDGDQHRTDRRAWQYERERRARLEDDGWRYVELTAISLTSLPHRRALVARLERHLR